MNKHELVNLIIGTVLIVLFFIGFTFVTDNIQANDTLAQWYKMDLYADHHHTPPSLVINHSDGKPGSYFELTGCNYPADSTATILTNGVTIGIIPVNGVGCFAFELSTAQAEEGAYFVTVTVNPSATVSFRLNTNSPDTWPSVSIGTVFSVPAGIALTEFNYLPIIVR